MLCPKCNNDQVLEDRETTGTYYCPRCRENWPESGKPTDEFATRQTLLEQLRETKVNNPAWSEFVNRYGKLILSVALKSKLSHADADDILQKTCEKVHKSIRKFDYDPSKGRFRSWLCLIVKQQIADHYRKLKKFPPLPSHYNENPEGPFIGIHDPVDDYQIIEEKEYNKCLIGLALEEVQKMIKTKHKKIFYAYVIEERTGKEVAEQLGVSVDLVYKTRQNVMPKLKKIIRRLKEEDE